MNIRPYLTPYKYGHPVLVGSGVPGSFDYHAVDCPFVFRHRDRFYMMYVGFDGVGYQTALATSEDLLRWEHLSTILDRDEGSRWDSRNIAGTWILRENDLHKAPTLKKWQGKYWLTYHSYPGDGYEAGAQEEDLTLAAAFGDQAARACRGRHRRAENPLDIGIGGHRFLELVVGDICVVIGFETPGNFLHVREMGLLVGNGAVDPFHLRL